MKWSHTPDPHGAGQAVALYESEGEILGTFAYSSGSIEVTQAHLSDIRWNRKTGAFAFKSKMSCCTQPNGGPNEYRRSRDLFTFTGTLRRKSLAGKLKRYDGYKPDSPVETKTISMKRLPLNRTPQRYDELVNQWPVQDW